MGMGSFSGLMVVWCWVRVGCYCLSAWDGVGYLAISGSIGRSELALGYGDGTFESSRFNIK